jgi:thiol-disulfide isomerase/thioredoxin
MNKNISILAAVLIAASMFSCDKIEPPYRQGGVVTAERKVLLEDYTGSRCVNCPSAARIAHDLKQVYGENLIVLGIHTGFFAFPFPPQFPLDLRTPAGEA